MMVKKCLSMTFSNIVVACYFIMILHLISSCRTMSDFCWGRAWQPKGNGTNNLRATPRQKKKQKKRSSVQPFYTHFVLCQKPLPLSLSFSPSHTRTHTRTHTFFLSCFSMSRPIRKRRKNAKCVCGARKSFLMVEDISRTFGGESERAHRRLW